MRTVVFQIALCALLFALSLPTDAQQPTRVHRIGYLSGTDRATDSSRAEGIRAALRELGYIEGQNIVIEYRHAGGRGREGYPELLADLVRLKVEVILVAGGTTPIRAAKNATKTIVMTGTGLDPVAAGFIESLARPGGNITGVTALNTELGGKRLELLKETVPKLTRVAVLYAPASPGPTREVREELPPAARALGLTMRTWEVRTVEDFDRIFAALNKDHVDGVYAILAGSLMRSHVKRMTNFALKNRVASVYDEASALEAGGLISYGADVAHSYQRVAYYVDRILKGAKPADPP